jgi:hypothetical protein
MGKVHMLHPSSGHDNFEAVSTQAAASSNNDQVTNQDQGSSQPTNKKEIETKTKDAIKAADESLSQASSNNSMTDKKN